jgi:integrase/recombinase XerD
MKNLPSEAASRLAALADDIAAFRHYLKAERGMAANTLLAYGRDLDRFALWVAGGGSCR